MGKSNKRIYIHSTVTKFLIVALSFLDTVIINRMMDVSVRGEYGVATNTITVLNLVFCLSIGVSYQLYYKQGENIKKLFVTLITLQHIIYLVLAAIYWIFTKNIWLSLIFLIAILAIIRDNTSSVNLVENITVRNNVYLISNVVYTALLGVFCACKIHGVYAFLFALFFRYFFETFISVVVQSYYKKFDLCSLKQTKTLKTIFKNAIAISVMGILVICNYNIDMIMLRWLNVSDYNIGLYSVAATLVNMVWIIPDAFKDVIINRLSRYDAVGEVKLTIKISCAVCVAILIGFIFLGKIFITIFYGEKYLDSYALTNILLVGSIPMVFYKLINPYLLSIGKKAVVIAFLSAAVIANVISNYITIPLYGEYGAATSSVISYSVCGGLFLIYFVMHGKCKNDRIS